MDNLQNAEPDVVHRSGFAPRLRLVDPSVLGDQDVDKGDRFVEYLPYYSLEAAAGYFGAGEAVEALGWLHVSGNLTEDMFVAKAVGNSMEPAIRNNDLCVFRRYRAGSRQGLTVLAQWSGPEDPDTGGSYTIKKYSSEKRVQDGELQHVEVKLSPENPDYEPIILSPDFENEVSIIAVFVEVLASA